MAQTSSQVTNYHAVAVSLAGAAAAYGLYSIYANYSDHLINRNLHRSNAVHRHQQRERPQQSSGRGITNTLEWVDPSDSAQLGGIAIHRGGDITPSYLIFFGVTPFPSVENLASTYRDPERIRNELQRHALDMVMTVLLAYTARSQIPEVGPMVDREGFLEVMEAIISRDGARLLALGPELSRIMGVGEEPSPHAENANRQIVEHESWATGPPRLPGSDSEEDPAILSETDMDMPDHGNRDPGQGLRGLLYYIAEEDATRKAYEHRGIRCEGCSQMPIRGIRYHCLNCPDFDLCASCEAHAVHQKTHVFAKIKIPLPVLSQPTKEYRLWYPGDPRKIHPSLDAALRKKIVDEYELEAPQVDALYEQFTCLANVPWSTDPSGITAAIDRRAFDKSMSSERWHNRFAPNAMFDRMFAFYDIDDNGLIGFKEFVDGFAYLRGPKRFASLQRAIRGFDVDGDGYVDRNDFLRMLRAKFEIQKQLIRDATEGQELEQTQHGWEVLKSSQPISSIFSDEVVPQGEERPQRGKVLVNGDMRPLHGIKGKTVLDNNDPFPRPDGAAAISRGPEQSHEILRRQLLSFEDLLYGREVSGEDMDQVDGMVRTVPLNPTPDPTLYSPHPGLPPIAMQSEDDDYDPYIQDVLWSVAEQGFNEILDPLFRSKEIECAEIDRTRADREKWSKLINDFNADEGNPLKQLETPEDSELPMFDPALAFDAASTSRLEHPTAFRGEIVPTDWESLSRLEADIPAAPLEDLLATSGYGVLGENEPPATGPRAASLGASTIWNGNGPRTATSPLRAVLSNAETDVESPDDIKKSKDVKSSSPPPKQTTKTTTPSIQQIRMWSILDLMEKELKVTGGPGRLSCGDVERIIVAKNSQALRGVVKSWLEFASF
jgi:Ca2+-binding EF-hand superfamily protein